MTQQRYLYKFVLQENGDNQNISCYFTAYVPPKSIGRVKKNIVKDIGCSFSSDPRESFISALEGRGFTQVTPASEQEGNNSLSDIVISIKEKKI